MNRNGAKQAGEKNGAIEKSRFVNLFKKKGVDHLQDGITMKLDLIGRVNELPND